MVVTVTSRIWHENPLSLLGFGFVVKLEKMFHDRSSVVEVVAVGW